MGLVRRTAHRASTLALALAEVNRASYASRDPSKRTEALAAAAESRAIEHRTDLTIGLTAVKDSDTESDVEVPKNRLGTRRKIRFGTCRVTVDKTRAVYGITDAPTAAQESDERHDRARTKASEAAQETLKAAMHKHLPPALAMGLPGLSENTLAQKAKMSRAKRTFQDALDALTDGQGLWDGPLPGPRGGNYYRPKAPQL